MSETFEVPARLKELFLEVCAVPRQSYHEEKIADHICAFAEARGFCAYRDEKNNVLVNLPATEGYENVPPILLQGHTDMVCEKNGDTVHDFLTEGISVVEQDGFLSADGTTLGADDGAAVAIMLYLIDGGFEHHPECQCLFTVCEEVGLDGAKFFDYSRIFARRIINLDSEDEGSVVVGCAGSVRTDVVFTPKYSADAAASERVKISVGGLFGGHSGENIACGRASANVLLGRILGAVAAQTRVNIVALGGGSKDNAIPREAFCTVSTDDATLVRQIAQRCAREISGELCELDSGLFVTCLPDAGYPAAAADDDTSRHIIDFLSVVRNGVLGMSNRLPGLVQLSRNVGIISQDYGKITVALLTRSDSDALLDASESELDRLGALCGAEVIHRNRYPGWSYTGQSNLLVQYTEIYERLFGKKIRADVIHAGLECGIIKSALPDADIISVGPDIIDIHSPNEKMSLESFGRIAAVLREIFAVRTDLFV